MNEQSNSLSEGKKLPYALLNCPLRFNPFQYDPYMLWKNQKGNKRIYIADEVGLGKTIEAGIIIKEELERNNECGKILIVAPRFLCEQWMEQLNDLFNLKSVIYPAKKKNEEAFDVIILPLSRLKKFCEEKKSLLEIIKTIIVDEAHYFRNGQGTSRYNSMSMIVEKIDNRILMSATPINNYSSDWTNQIELLKPSNTEECAVGSNQNSGWITHNKKAEAFPYCKIRSIKTIYCTLTEDEQRFYDTTDEVSETEFGKTIFRHIGASSLYALNQCYKNNGFDEFEWDMIKEEYSEVYLENDSEEYEIGGLETSALNSETDTKADSLIKILNDGFKHQENSDNNRDKAVIFAHYLATCEHLVEYLNNQEGYTGELVVQGNDKIRIFSIMGKMTQIEQQKIAKNFKECNGNAVLICSDVCKEGVNLQCANILVNYDLPFNPAIMEQRIGRIDRVGQAKDIYIYNFIVENTYDITVYYQFILGKLSIIINYSKPYGINRLNITSDNENEKNDVENSIEKAYKYANNIENEELKNKEISEIKEYLINYILSGSTYADKNEYKNKKEELDKKELNEQSLDRWKKMVNEVKESQRNFINEEAFDKKLKSFYQSFDITRIENVLQKSITIKINEKIINTIKEKFKEPEYRRWLRVFLNLDESNGGFDVYKYLKDSQDLDGAISRIVVKESEVVISYDYLNPEINKTGICEKDFGEYLDNFVPVDILKELELLNEQ